VIAMHEGDVLHLVAEFSWRAFIGKRVYLPARDHEIGSYYFKIVRPGQVGRILVLLLF